MKRRQAKFLWVGILVMALFFNTVTSYGESVEYINGIPTLEEFMYFDADNVPLRFEYDTMEETSKYLAPGIKETKSISYDNDTMQHVDYTCEFNPNDGTTEVLLGYEPGRLTSVSEQIATVEGETGKNIVAGVNGCFFDMETTRPSGLIVSNGRVLNEAKVPMPGYTHIDMYENIFVITNEGEAKILQTRDLCYDEATDSYTPIQDGQFQFAISGNALVVRPNKRTGKPEVVYFGYEPDARSQKNARTAVGIKDDGTVVLFSTNGKMSPFNYGYTCTELGRVMKAKGCHTAMLLDGGGSATYVSQYPGEDEDVCRTSSSEGTQREVCAGILIATTASEDGRFSPEEAESLQQTLTPCEKNGHKSVIQGEKVVCETCGVTTDKIGFTGLAFNPELGGTQFLCDGTLKTGFVAYDMFQMRYFDQQGLSCEVNLDDAQMPSCTEKGYLTFSCSAAPEGQQKYHFDFPKATGHDYEQQEQMLVCKKCGWKGANINDCEITIANAGYTGEAKYPKISVVAPDGTLLVRSSDGLVGDYKRKISNNTEIGMAKVEFSPIVYYVNRIEDRSSIIGTRMVEFPILPSPAKHLTVSKVGVDCVDLSWSPSPSAGGDYEITYDIYGKKAQDWEKLGSTTELSYSIQGLEKATPYIFGIRATAVGKDGQTYASWSMAEGKATTLGLKAPSNLKISNVAKTGKIKLSWKKVKNASAYKVYRSISIDGIYEEIATTTISSYTDITAESSQLYFYKVQAVKEDDSRLDSELSELVKRRCDLPRPIVTASNNPANGKVKLFWDTVEGAEKYKIYRSETKEGTYKYVNTTTKVEYINQSAQAGKVYYYKVKAIDTDHASANSALSVADKRTCDLKRPVVTAKANGKKIIKLTWKKVAQAERYEVYRAALKTGKYKKIATTTKLSYTNKKLIGGKIYYYKVKAIASNTAANSAFSVVDKCKAKK